ncbi:MAG TPA: iron ABC transporter permease [Spirochaetota bacterium]|nr:iron ABC transporter permease [Spirochaetota bacterium]HPJ35780.1 iron ABC transporter permease [Spirochaetota bacterium]
MRSNGWKLLIYISPVATGIFALFIGSYGIPVGEVLRNIWQLITMSGNLTDIPEYGVIFDIRLPRIILAAIAGGALSVSGVTLQGIFRNPLVDPFILGISAGAALGCALSIGFFPGLPVQPAAFFFSVAAVAIALAAARTQGEVSRLPLILSGVIVSAFFSALVSIVKFLVDPHKLQNIVYWLMGSFALAEWRTVKIAGAGIIAGFIPIYLMRWRLNIMSMGEAEAKNLGVNVRRERIIFIAASTLMVSIAVSVSGIIGWVGLMVPHLIRMSAGPDHRGLVPLSMAGGAAFMIVSDTIARSATSLDIPVGIITAILGAPFFIFLMKRNGSEAWRE